MALLSRGTVTVHTASMGQSAGHAGHAGRAGANYLFVNKTRGLAKHRDTGEKTRGKNQIRLFIFIAKLLNFHQLLLIINMVRILKIFCVYHISKYQHLSADT